jgi:hypothetical protein
LQVDGERRNSRQIRVGVAVRDLCCACAASARRLMYFESPNLIDEGDRRTIADDIAARRGKSCIAALDDDRPGDFRAQKMDGIAHV